MGKNTKRIIRFYSAWNYQREADDLNRRSQEGWQLVHGGLFSSTFRKDDSVRYIYQLDYEQRIDNFARYLDTFREQGWEYVNSTGNGWSYFRKVYDPSLPAEEYEIFTDTASLQEMQSRWARIAGRLCILLFLLSALELYMNINAPRLHSLILNGMLLLELIILGYGYIIMKNPRKRKSTKGDGAIISALLIVFVLSLVSSVTLMCFRTDSSCTQEAAERNPIQAALSSNTVWNEFKIRYTDYFSLDLEIDSANPVTVTFMDENEKIVYQKTGSNLEVNNALLKLHKGRYKVHLSDFAGGQLRVSYDLD